MPKEIIKPYTSRGKKISKSSHHEDLWIVDIIGTNKFYAIHMSTQLMLQNNPPDPEVKKISESALSKLKNAKLLLTSNHNLETGRMNSLKTNRSQNPKGLANTL